MHFPLHMFRSHLNFRMGYFPSIEPVKHFGDLKGFHGFSPAVSSHAGAPEAPPWRAAAAGNLVQEV